MLDIVNTVGVDEDLYDTTSGSNLNVSLAGGYEVEVVDSNECSTMSLHCVWCNTRY